MKTDIRGVVRPSGKTYSLEEFRRGNRYLAATIEKMGAFAEAFAKRHKLSGPLFICLTLGDRDTSGIGFEYSDDPRVEDRLNRTFSAKEIKKFANGLPPGQRKAYLADFRKNGWKGYV